MDCLCFFHMADSTERLLQVSAGYCIIRPYLKMHDKCSGGKGKKSMDNVKIGNLINKLRKEKGMTQLQLAERLHISDKTVSKWERGQGCPDVSLLTDLSRVFGVDLEKLLSGQLDTN